MKFNFIILFLYSFVGFSQGIKYELYVIDPCTEKIEKSNNYLLEKNGTDYPSFFGNGTIELPEEGKYELIIGEEKHNILINKTINSDTLRKPKIEEFLVTHSKPAYVFRCCKELCDGIETDYYSNGSIRIKGEFQKGFVVGELKKYFQNGNLKEFSVYNKKGFLSIKTLFFENGKIKNLSIYNKHGILTKETLFEQKITTN